MSEAAMEAIVQKLEKYDDMDISRALDECQVEVAGHLSLSDITRRLWEIGKPQPEKMTESEVEAAHEKYFGKGDK